MLATILRTEVASQISINNENFKGSEFATFKNESGSNRFKMSPQKWIRETNNYV